MTGFTIRQVATHQDYVAVIDLIEGMAVWDIGQSAAYGMTEAEIRGLYYTDTVQSLQGLVDAGNHVWLATIRTPEGQDIDAGVAILTFDGDSIAWLQRLYVDPRHRGLGIGAALIAKSVEIARTSGVSEIRLLTAAFMKDAHKLYHKAGFQRCAMFDGFDDMPESDRAMRLVLTDQPSIA